MSAGLRRALAIAIAAGSAAGVAITLDGCGDSTGDSTSSVPSDGSATVESDAADDAPDDAGDPDSSALDASCPKVKVMPETGETCVGFGEGSPCDPACGLPAYGYVCFNGGPPGFTGCVQASGAGSFGETYCCPESRCVPEPDQDKECKSASAPRRYQCPPDGKGGTVAPPVGCADAGSGGSAIERFFCCP